MHKTVLSGVQSLITTRPASWRTSEKRGYNQKGTIARAPVCGIVPLRLRRGKFAGETPALRKGRPLKRAATRGEEAGLKPGTYTGEKARDKEKGRDVARPYMA